MTPSVLPSPDPRPGRVECAPAIVATFKESFVMSQASDPIVITGLARTPMGGLQGMLSGFSANQLGAAAIKAAVERSGLKAGDVDDVIMGNCLPAGQGQAPARQAARGAALAD